MRKDLLERLSNAHGVSGYEGNVRKIIENEVRPYADEIRIDRMGNLIATKSGGNPVVMLAAHMDEIGLMVKYIDEKGFAFFAKTGGWFDQTLLNKRMVLHTENGPVYGVIGGKPPHAMKEEEKKKPVKVEDMFIDVGARDRDDAEKLGVKIGTPVMPDMEFRTLGNGMVTGKALDNRGGCAALIEAMRRMGEVKATVHAVFTVQEEVGLKGARTSAFGLNPDVALAVDVTFAGDHPGIEKKDSTLEIGKGPAITVSDASGEGIIVPEAVLKWLKGTAESNNIPYQLKVGAGGTTDASIIHLSREGIPTGVISTPSRYIHTPVTVMNMDDLENSTQLITHAVGAVGKFF
ncbi:MAG: M42 family metallopeptidase [Candidatus Methanoperedens sp.]|nr:M42 family metallopeptidase [Candidatus Methanoperedens sp.]MCZ7370568.1 M42 family metallopeptidase [Candidatus Methanoperedens sp.]